MAENHHSERKPPQWGLSLAWFLLLAMISVAFYWKLVLTDQYVWFDHPDMAFLEIPRVAFQAREIHAGRFPLWDPYIWMGQPLIGQTQPGPLYPLNLLFSLTGLKGGYLRFSHLNAYWVVLHFLAAWFFFLLARDLSLSRQAALAGACIFGFGGFVGSVAWLDVLNGAIWAPLVFLFLLRAARGAAKWRDSALGGLFLGMAWLSGHHEMPILIGAAAGATWLWLAWRDRRLMAHAVLFFTVAILIGGVQLLPTIEFGRLSRRWIGIGDSLGWKDKVPYLSQTIYSLSPRALLGTLVPAIGTFADTSPYIGWMAGALALAGVAMSWARRTVRWATALLAVAVVYSLGALTPLNGVLYAAFPLMDKARIPARGVILIHVALAVLAAFGMEAVLAGPQAAWTRRIRHLLTWIGTAMLAAALTTDKLADNMHVLGALAALSGAAVIAGWGRGALTKPVVVTAIVSIILIELTGGAPSAYPNRHSKDANRFTSQLTSNQDIAWHLMSAAGGPARAAIDDTLIGANFGDWHGVDMYQGYVAGATENLTSQEMHLPRTQDLFGVTHWVGKEPNRPGQELAFTGSSGLKVFRNPPALPRVRIVHQTRSVKNRDELRYLIREPEVNLAQTALFVGEAPQLESCAGGDRVTLVERTTDKLVIDAELACKGLLVISDTFYPGWRATVDGNPVPILEAYGSLQSVVVEGGKHRIDLLFRPWPVYLGAAMTLSGLLIVALAWRLSAG